jgi:uncharacterized protein YlxP (DUF503 family)
MFVGVLRLVLQIPGARSLKDKRRVAVSLKERLQGRLHVSAAEVGSLDDPRYAEIGVAVVSNDAAVCDRVLADAASMAGTHPDAVLADRRFEVVPFGAGGSGLAHGIEATGHGPPASRISIHEEPTSLGDEDATWCGDEEADDEKGPA